jgi:hypothetical protein
MQSTAHLSHRRSEPHSPGRRASVGSAPARARARACVWIARRCTRAEGRTPEEGERATRRPLRRRPRPRLGSLCEGCRPAVPGWSGGPRGSSPSWVTAWCACGPTAACARSPAPAVRAPAAGRHRRRRPSPTMQRPWQPAARCTSCTHHRARPRMAAAAGSPGLLAAAGSVSGVAIRPHAPPVWRCYCHRWAGPVARCGAAAWRGKPPQPRPPPSQMPPPSSRAAPPRSVASLSPAPARRRRLCPPAPPAEPLGRGGVRQQRQHRRSCRSLLPGAQAHPCLVFPR